MPAKRIPISAPTRLTEKEGARTAGSPPVTASRRSRVMRLESDATSSSNARISWAGALSSSVATISTG
jgi:hypothetical protein